MKIAIILSGSISIISSSTSSMTGSTVTIDADKLYAMQELREDLQVILAKAVCKNISKEEVHQLVDEIYSNYADET